MPHPLFVALDEDTTPHRDPSAWVAPGAVIAGAVTLSEQSSIWYNAVLRADSNTITLGARSNVQDGVVIHVDRDFPVEIGADVSIGHNAVIHGATVHDGCLIGMNATILNGAVIGANSLVAAGALVTQHMMVPEGSLVAGVPARIMRSLTEEELNGLAENAAIYLKHTERHSRTQNMQ